MGEVRDLPVDRNRGKTVVGVLTEMLHRAKDGEIETIAVIAMTYDGRAKIIYTPTQKGFALVGLTEIMKHDIMSDLDD